MATKRKEPPPKPSRAEIERYLEIEAERKALGRQSSDLKKEQDEIGAKLLDFVREEGGKLRAVVRCDHRLAIKLQNGSVSWKSEFVRVAGKDEAERIAASQPQKEDLLVERVE